MPTCQNCKQRWSWSQAFKKSFSFRGMTCPHCKTKQYMSAAYRKKSSIYAAIVPIPLFINIFFDITITLAFIIGFVFAVIVLGIHPFLMELSNEEEPLF